MLRIKSIGHRHYWARLIAILSCWLGSCDFTSLYSQELSELTEIHLSCWRAFHGTVETDILKNKSGKYLATTTIFDREGKPVNRIGPISLDPSAFARLSLFFNDKAIRDYFINSKILSQLDGAALSLTVRQNNFALRFDSEPTEDNRATPDGLFRKIFLELISDCGLPLSLNESWKDTVVSEIKFTSQNWGEVVQDLAHASDAYGAQVPVKIYSLCHLTTSSGQAISLPAKFAKFDAALESVCRQFGLSVKYKDDVAVVGELDRLEKFGKAYKSPNSDLRRVILAKVILNNTSIQDAVRLINKQLDKYPNWSHSVRIIVDSKTEVSFTGSYVSLGDLLSLISAQMGLPWDSVFAIDDKPTE